MTTTNAVSLSGPEKLSGPVKAQDASLRFGLSTTVPLTEEPDGFHHAQPEVEGPPSPPGAGTVAAGLAVVGTAVTLAVPKLRNAVASLFRKAEPAVEEAVSLVKNEGRRVADILGDFRAHPTWERQVNNGVTEFVAQNAAGQTLKIMQYGEDAFRVMTGTVLRGKRTYRVLDQTLKAADLPEGVQGLLKS